MTKTTAELCKEAIELAKTFHKQGKIWFFSGLMFGVDDVKKLDKVIDDLPVGFHEIAEEGRDYLINGLFKTTCKRCYKDFSNFEEVKFCPFCGDEISV